MFFTRGALVPQEPVAVTLTVEPDGMTAGKVMLFEVVPPTLIIAPGTFVLQL
jgi:hypothetical protein